jgi:peptidoglycan/LPS O-acetylase OafA/YrhL
MATVSYRRDIDGLRAIAVASVILFHTFASWLPGGYLGVDIFFVLSGFLITSIIQGELDSGHFSIVRFYERRIRRIIPALLAMLLVTSMVSIAILLPADLIGFAKSALATLTFSANIYFWLDTSYFARAAEEKPLLHIWSLGVEEQFYVLFPLILWSLARLWRNAALPIVILLSAASLLVNIVLNKVGGANPAFFLIPSRAWELGGGVILALMPVTYSPRGRWAESAAALGLCFVTFALWRSGAVYNILPPALPAVIGTCGLIFAARDAEPVTNKFLAWWPLVFLGQISYSLYLWHWPILVFMRYYLVRELTIPESIIAFLLMFALAFASWKWIERPFRNGSLNLRSVLAYSLAGSALAASIAAVCLLASGLPSRLPADAAQINAAVGTNFRCAVLDYRKLGSARACVLNLPSGDMQDSTLVLFGNSHAQMYAPLVADMAHQSQVPALLVPMNGCLPTLNLSVDCIETARGNLATVLSLPKVKLVVVGLNWNAPVDALVKADGTGITQSFETALIESLDDLIQQIKSSGRDVVLIGPIYIPGWDIASTLSRERAFGWPLSHVDHVARQQFEISYAAEIAHFSASLDEKFLRPDRIQCDTEICHFIIDGHSLFADSNHLARAELPRFKAAFAPISQMLNSVK